jgi:hypothetical protein
MLKRWMVALALLALPTAAFAQGGGGGRGMGMGMMQSPIKIVLDHKADLTLTAEQVTKLETLEKGLTEKNAPHTAEIAKIREANPDMRNMPDEARAKMREHNQAVQANNTSAREELKTILNETQLAAATKFIEEAMPPRGRRGGGGF